MNAGLKKQLIVSIIRFKRADNCMASAAHLHLSELAVMARAAVKCDVDGQGMCASQIQETLHISKPAVSQTLNNLEKKGYITRSIDPADRRKIVVELTEQGKAELEACTHYYDGVLCAVLEEMGEENASAMIRQINLFMDILERQ